MRFLERGKTGQDGACLQPVTRDSDEEAAGTLGPRAPGARGRPGCAQRVR